MPLSCLDEGARRIQAFDLGDEDWARLQSQNRRDRHLRMSCCDAGVVVKRSKRGTKFFAHRKIDACLTADESEEHRQLKLLAVEAARACGWQAETEVSGSTPSGENWRADVLATRGNAKVAIEVQWSGQTIEETLRRQAQYRASGVRGLWLLRQPGFPISRELPAACIGGCLDGGFEALIPAHDRMRARDRMESRRWRQATPMREFLEGALARRLKFVTLSDAFEPAASVSVESAEAECWGSDCGCLTNIVIGVTIQTNHGAFGFDLSDLTDHPAVTREVIGKLPSGIDGRLIQKRYSRTQRRRYLSHGCAGCSRFFGELMPPFGPRLEVAGFPIRLDDAWLLLLKSHPDVGIGSPAWWLQRA